MELGLSRAGHETLLLCENDLAANAVLDARFKGARRHLDVRKLAKLPRQTQLLTAGFPCQDLSSVGARAGIDGEQSGLVGHVFRLLRTRRVPWVLLENVPFMLQLHKGRALHVVVNELASMGYRWAYRVVDTRAFGLPHRRLRVFILASLHEDPGPALFAGSHEPPPELRIMDGRACGFYWTEGNRGLGWAYDAVPTLKGGSSFGIPSPPAIVLPTGRIIMPDIRDAERLQGFRERWTEPAETVVRPNHRWKLVGNAVTVNVAQWIGEALLRRPHAPANVGVPLSSRRPLPTAAWGSQDGSFEAPDVTTWPRKPRSNPHLESFLKHPGRPLSARATAGFHSRLLKSSLVPPEGFIQHLEHHLEEVSNPDTR